MRIGSVTVHSIKVPLEPRIVSAVGSVDHIGCLLVVVSGPNGLTGENVVFTLNDRFTPVLRALIEELAGQIVGRDINDLSESWDRLHGALGFFGVKGFSTIAIGALDGALWDLRGKEKGLSISAMLGRRHDVVNIYDSGGLWLHMSQQDLRDYAQASLDAGFRALKLRLGAQTVKEDFARIEVLASAIAGRAFLMADANQFYAEPVAIEVGHGLQKSGYGWYEEPSSQLDLRSAARIREVLDIPIASGENCYSRFDAIDLFASKSLQVFMPDLQRIGGVTEFARSMTLAQAQGIDISSHLFPEYSLQLLGAAGKQGFLEYVPWFSSLYNERIEIRDGLALVPDRPGWGFTLNWRAIEKHFYIQRG